MRLGIAISNAATASPTHTTVHIIAAALRAGHAVRTFEPWDFEVAPNGRLNGRAHVFDAPMGEAEVAAALSGRRAERRRIEVDRLDALLLRINPIDLSVLSFAHLVQAAGVTVVNTPQSLIACSHKGWLATLAGVSIPKTMVTRSPSAAEAFAASLDGAVVLKPARSSGGRGVSVLRHRRRATFDLAFEEAARSGDGYVVAQAYLPAAADGEKRLLWLDGELLGGYLRERASNDFRHNLKVGGQPVACLLTDTDHALLRALTPHLRAQGVWFAGVDVIGAHVVEVNVLNPGGIHWSSTFAGAPLADRLVAALHYRLSPSMHVISE